jgi:hypothetical protein
MGKGDISYKRVRRRAQRSSGRGMDSRNKSVYDRCVNLHEAVFGGDIAEIEGAADATSAKISSMASSVSSPSYSDASSSVAGATSSSPIPSKGCFKHLIDSVEPDLRTLVRESLQGRYKITKKNRKKTKGLKKEVTMKITKRQLRRIINEALNEYSKADPPKVSPLLDMNASEQAKALANQPAADPAYVLRALEHHYNRGVHPSQRRGMPFGGMGVNPIMDALMIDDVWPEEEEALQKIVSDGGAESLEELATMVADWLTKKRRGQLVTDEGMAKAMESWR